MPCPTYNQAWRLDLAHGVLRSGPWGRPGNSEGLTHSASENGAQEGCMWPSRAPFSLAEGCSRPSQPKTELGSPFSLTEGCRRPSQPKTELGSPFSLANHSGRHRYLPTQVMSSWPRPPWPCPSPTSNKTLMQPSMQLDTLDLDRFQRDCALKTIVQLLFLLGFLLKVFQNEACTLFTSGLLLFSADPVGEIATRIQTNSAHSSSSNLTGSRLTQPSILSRLLNRLERAVKHCEAVCYIYHLPWRPPDITPSQSLTRNTGCSFRACIPSSQIDSWTSPWSLFAKRKKSAEGSNSKFHTCGETRIHSLLVCSLEEEERRRRKEEEEEKEERKKIMTLSSPCSRASIF
ncbi:hypothetical protein L345_17303, partial [Ophiophagus hannah]